MQQNNNIISALRKWRKLLLGLLFSQFSLFVAVNLLMKRFLDGFELTDYSLKVTRIIVCVVLICFYIILDGSLLKRIRKTKALIDAKPIKCTVEDIILIRYRRENQIRYNAYFLLKSEETQQLLFTYGKYSLSYYNYSVTQTNKSLNSAFVFRKDGSKVQIGDTVYAYIKRFVDVDVNNDSNTLKLNKKQIHYHNINKEYDINVFNTLKFFEGVVEIENIDI